MSVIIALACQRCVWLANRLCHEIHEERISQENSFMKQLKSEDRDTGLGSQSCGVGLPPNKSIVSDLRGFEFYQKKYIVHLYSTRKRSGKKIDRKLTTRLDKKGTTSMVSWFVG